MKLYFEFLKLLFKKYVLRITTGTVIKDFCMNMGIVYIKMGQILATQNFGNIFSESDRQTLSSICDHCKTISFHEIKKIIEAEYGCKIEEIFVSIDEEPVGSASISQVHRATLKNGKVVAIKVKRKDITNGIDSDVKKIKKLVHRFGNIVGVKNLTGGDKALDLYLTWIKEETDFKHEKQNMIDYYDFSVTVNGKVQNTRKILVPKVCDELCTENIIVMDYIDNKTINQLELNDLNKNEICESLNSYLQLSFCALLHGKKIIFHGDPHGANIYLDENGNIGFLDMGLIFELSENDSNLARTFFLSAYTNNHEKMQELLIPYGKFDPETEKIFRQDISIVCDKVQNMPVTSYFTEFIAVVAKYDMVPPVFLFQMAKAFVCLGGINTFSENIIKATELLKEQVIEFYINRSMKETMNFAIHGLTIAPRFLIHTLQYGFIRGLAMEGSEIQNIQTDLKQTLKHYKEIIGLVLPNENDITECSYQRTMNDRKR